MNDQRLCEIVHEATAGPLFPRGTHSGETMAVARAVREACAKIAEAENSHGEFIAAKIRN